MTGDALQQETISAEDTGTKRLLKSDAQLDLRRGAEKSVTVNHEFVTGGDFDGNNVAG